MKLIVCIKKTLFVFVAITCITLTGEGQQRSRATRDRIRIDQLANEWKDAYNSNDTAKLASLYTEDAEYVSPHVANLILRGRENIVMNFHRGRTSGGQIDTVVTLTTHIAQDIAYALCRYEATNNGQKVNGRNVIVFKKVKGKWCFAVHASIVRD